MTKPAPICDNCSAPDALLYQHTNAFSEFYCPACLVKRATFEAAYIHLHTLLESAVMDWLTVWQNTGIKVDISEYVSMIAVEIDSKYRAGQLFSPAPAND